MQKWTELAEKDKARYYAEGGGGAGAGKGGKAKKEGPKKASTSFIHYCTSQRAAVKADYPDLEAKEVSAKLGEIWK